MDIKHFINQKSYEKVALVVRRHFITFAPALILFLVLFFAVPVFSYWLISNLFSNILIHPIFLPLLILGAGIYFLSVLLFFYTYFVTFYLDTTIITTDRLVDVEQQSLFSRTVSELDLYQIQDATSEVKGLLPSLFNYGNVIIQTAGPVNQFIMDGVPDPHNLRQMLLNLSSEDKKFHSK